MSATKATLPPEKYVFDFIQTAQACLRDATPRAAVVLVSVLERWNGLTDTQRARVYVLVEQLHTATSVKRAGRAMLGGAR